MSNDTKEVVENARVDSKKKEDQSTGLNPEKTAVKTKKSSQKKNDDISERAQEIVDRACSVITGSSANDTEGTKDLPTDPVSRFAVVAGRTAGKLAVGVGKLARSTGQAIAGASSDKKETSEEPSSKEEKSTAEIKEENKTEASKSSRKASSSKSKSSSSLKQVRDKRSAKKEEKEAIREDRRSILEGADYASSYKAYRKMLTKGGARKSGVLVELHNTPGCYAVATYPPKLKWDRDLASYTDIYVGQASCVGEGILECCSRQGCADVYADVKYKQNVQIFIFNCDEDELDDVQQELIEALGADESYNALM